MATTSSTPYFPTHQTTGVIPSARQQSIADWILANISGKDGVRVRRGLNGGLEIIGPGSDSFSGTVYLAGQKYTGLNSDSNKPWVRVYTDGSSAPAEATGPPSDPFPDNEEWYAKSSTSGDIHIPRVG